MLWKWWLGWLLVTAIVMTVKLSHVENKDLTARLAAGVKLSQPLQLKWSAKRRKYYYQGNVLIDNNQIYLLIKPDSDLSKAYNVKLIGKLRLSQQHQLAGKTLYRRWWFEGEAMPLPTVGVRSWLIEVKQTILQQILLSLPPDQAGLLAGMVWGSKQGLSSYFQNRLIVTGVIHVVVASGFNVMLLMSFVTNLLKGRLGLWWVLLLSQVTVWLYVLMVGFEPPVVRAGLMSGLIFLQVMTGRVRQTLSAWWLVLCLSLMIQPAWLFSLSWQLSQFSTLGIILFSNRFQDWLEAVAVQVKILPKTVAGNLIDSLATTVSAQLLVWPIIAYVFGRVSLLGLLVNPLVLWVVPLVTIVGMVLSWLTVIWPGLAGLYYWLLNWPLSWFIGWVNLFADWQLPGVMLGLQPSYFSMIAYYLGVLGLAVRLNRQPNEI